MAQQTQHNKKTNIVSHFDELVDNGLQIIPLWENSKIPMCKNWTIWNKNQSREILERYPDANIGILLGGIVDVEGDSLDANNRILKIIGDYPHPSYRSTKSIHHLFLNPDPKLNILKYQNIEFRGYKHQSVMPPSHHQGVFYEWVNSLFPIPEMPEELVAFYKKVKNGKYPLQKGLISINCADCNKKKLIHKNRLTLELKIFKKFFTPWSCHKCRLLDIRKLCKTLRKTGRRDGSYC